MSHKIVLHTSYDLLEHFVFPKKSHEQKSQVALVALIEGAVIEHKVECSLAVKCARSGSLLQIALLTVE